MSRLTWAKRLVVATTTLALAGTMPLPATASPSEGKAVLSQGHTDSPKAYWENDSLTLKASGQHTVPLENAVHWLHQGHDPKGKQYFHYTVGEEAKYRFLGEAGDLLYFASAAGADGGVPNLWIGFGAEADIPVEEFRDETFQLELLDFQGPGEMEIFREAPDDLPQERYLSSHRDDYRFVQLSAGAHTHLNTTFSKPGTYNLTYRTSYRDAKTGAFVTSTPQVMQWQVGGTDPNKATLGNVIDAYNASKDKGTSTSFKPTLTLAPAQSDDPMTDLTFDTGDAKATGNVAFYIDGSYLAELPLSQGKATWREMIGSKESSFQAVYVPGAESPAPRWMTAPLAYTHGGDAVSTAEPGKFPTPANSNPVPAHHLDPANVTSRDFTVTSKLEGDSYVISAIPSDPSLEFTLVGGFGADKRDIIECPITFTSTRAARSMTIDKSFVEDSCNAAHAIWDVTPATQYDAGRTTFEIDADNAAFSGTGTFTEPKPVAPSTPPSNDGKDTEEPSTPPTTGDKDTEDTAKQDVSILDEKVTITDGHLDYGPIVMPDGTLRVIVGDDSRTKAKKTVLRDPDSVTLAATLNDRPRSSRVFGDKSYDFLGVQGTPLFALPQTQAKGLVWPGFSTERLPTASFPGGTTLHIKAVTVPDEGKAWAFTSGLAGVQDILVDSTKPDGTKIVNSGPAHIHANWVFTKPGTYEFSIQASGTDKDGTSITSQPGTIRFVIADKDLGKTKDSQEQGEGQGASEGSSSNTSTGSESDTTAPPDNGSSSEGSENNAAAGTGPATVTGGTGAASQPTIEQCIPTPVETEVGAPVAKAAGGSYTVPANTHAHPNWVFTKPGTYKVTLTQTATLKNGKRAQATGTLTFNVGGSGNANSGHFDIGSVLEGDNLFVKVKDDRTQPAKWVDPNTLTFGLGNAAKATAPAGLEFIAPKGAEIWMISSASVNGVPWVGANTQHPSIVSGTTGEVTWSLSNVSGPGQLAVFSSGNLGQVVGQRWFGGASGSAGQLPAGVQKKDGKFIKTEWVGKTPSGKDCQLSAEQIAKLKAEGKNVGAGQVKALTHTGATVATLTGLSAVLLGAGIALTARKRRA